MTTLNSRLQLALLNRKENRNKGFTLVELMIVIVIVGILAAVALPNFLNQTKKAKGTEAKSDQSAIMKNASAEFQQGGSQFVTDLFTSPTASAVSTYTDATDFTGSGDCVPFGSRSQAETTKFDYACSVEEINTTNGPVLFADAGTGTYTTGQDPAQAAFVVTAVGDGNDSGLGREVITFAINLNNGTTELVRAGTCTSFGGTVTAGNAPATGAMAIDTATTVGATPTC